jgi:PAS domain S-box-containing protein
MKKILIIDDAHDNLEAIKATIEELISDCIVLIAESGKEGLKIAKNKQPDVIISDIIMPEMDGIEVCKRLRADEVTKHIPIIIHTGSRTDTETRIQCLEAGAEVFLAKPIEAGELIAQINAVLRIKIAEDALLAERKVLDDAVKKRTKELQESEKYFKTLFNIMIDPVIIIDSKGKFVEITDRIEELTGLKREDFIGKNFMKSKITSAKYKAILMKNLVKRMMGINVAPYEIEILSADGEKMPFEINAAKIDYKGIPADMVVFRDIKDRKKAQKELAESEQLTRTIIENSPIGISVRDKNGTLLLSNKAWKTLWGFSEKDVSSYRQKRKKLVFDEKDSYLHDHLDEIRKVYSEGGQYFIQDIKLSRIKKNRAEWISQYFYSIKDEHGEVEKVVILTEDITERKKAEEELHKYHNHLEELVNERTVKLEKENAEREEVEVQLRKYRDHLEELVEERTLSLKQSEEKYKGVYDNMHLGIYRTTPEGQILMANPALLEMLKFDSFEDLQKRDLEIDGYCTKNLRKEFKKYIQKNKQIRGFESTWKTADGKKVYVRENAKAFYDKDGNVMYYEGTVEDITEKKKAEEELKINRERLKTANSILRHDITNDLVVIKSALDIYREEHDKGMLDEIDKRVEKSLDTIKKQRVQEQFLHSHADLDEYVIENVAHDVAKNYPDFTINVTGKGKAYADNAIYSVFENIISNAIKHSKTAKLDIAISSDDDHCVIKFMDYGIGIPDDIKNKIFFEGFHYGKTGHTGIGLYIVQKTIDEYDGEVFVEDNKPTGAIFVVRLRKIIER